MGKPKGKVLVGLKHSCTSHHLATSCLSHLDQNDTESRKKPLLKHFLTHVHFESKNNQKLGYKTVVCWC